MKAGKSTIINALIREKLVFTANLVATYSVTWFKYGKEKRIEVVFKDGSTEFHEIDAIEYWSVIDNVDKNKRLRDVKYIIIYYPNEMLKKIELIDTPGLFSPEDEKKGDTKNALDFLGLGINSAREINSTAESEADAIIYAFGRGFKEDDLKVVKAFTTTSINAIGIFSKIDQVGWDPYGKRSPAELVRGAVANYSEALKENLYRIIPVTALCVEGALSLADKDWQVLLELSELEEKIFLKIIADAGNFANKVYEGVPAPEKRKPLIDLLGQYGIYLAVQAIKAGVDRADLVEYMYEKSGLNEAYSVILSHFGNRAYLIKAVRTIERIEKKIDLLRYSTYSNEVSVVCGEIMAKIEDLRRDNSFVELEMLRKYYAGRIKLPHQKNTMMSLSLDEQLLHIMGEYGCDCLSRLGCTSFTSFEALKEIALSYISDWSRLTAMHYPKEINLLSKVIISRLRELYTHLDELSG